MAPQFGFIVGVIGGGRLRWSAAVVGDGGGGGALGAAPPGFPPLRSWAAALDSPVARCPSWHPPVFAALSSAIAAARSLLPLAQLQRADGTASGVPAESSALRAAVSAVLSGARHGQATLHPMLVGQLLELERLVSQCGLRSD